MYKSQELLAEMIRNGVTRKELSESTGIKYGTLNEKIRLGNWYIDEIQSIQSALNLSVEKLSEIFFA